MTRIQVKRAAARFGLVAAAGELAAVMGILPWPGNESIKAAEACFKDWLEQRGGSGAAELEAGIAQVRLFFEQHGESRFTPWDEVHPERKTINSCFNYR